MGHGLGCLPRMRKLLEFDFSTTIDGAIKYGAAKIGDVEDEVSDKQTVKCEVAATP